MESLTEDMLQNDESDSGIVSYLKNEIRKRDQDIHLAATFGKQLLEEKQVLDEKLNDLTVKNDALEQEKHALQIEVDNLKQSLKSHASEIDDLRDKLDNASKKYTDHQKDHAVILTKVANLNKENQGMKKDLEDKHLENSSLKKKIQLQEEQIKTFQNQVEISLLDVTMDDGLQLKEELNMYITKNKDLQDAFSECQYELEALKLKEGRLNEVIESLREDVADRDKEIASYSAEVKKSRDEMAELQGEIEVMRFQGVDFNKKGNSVYSELDDRRKVVEKRYKLLEAKYQRMQNDYEEKKQELISARMQMANLLCMKSFEHQQSYINRLQSDLKAANMEVRRLTIKLQKMCKQQQALNAEDKVFSKKDEYGFLRILLQDAQKKEENLTNELMNQRVKNITLNEKLIETQRYLYQAKLDLEICTKENLKLQTELKGMETVQMLEKNLAAKAERTENIEKLPGFQATDKNVLNAEKSQAFNLENGKTLSDKTISDKDCYSKGKSSENSNKFTSSCTPSVKIKECDTDAKTNYLNKTDIATEHAKCSPAIIANRKRGDKNDNCTHQ